MKIEQLSATGLQAGDFSHQLQSVNVIVGDNFKGKTTRLNAIRLALMGYLPELGKTAAATFQLARGATMDVQAVFTDDHAEGIPTIRWSWEQKRGKIEALTSGDMPAVPAVLMDSNEYFALGAKDRMRLVFGLARVEALEGVPVAEKIISRFKLIKVEDHTEQHEAVIQRIVTTVDESDQIRHDAEQSVQDWVECLVADMREILKGAKQSADRMAKTVQGLVVIQAQDDDAAIQNVTRQLERARQDSTDLATQLGTTQEQCRALERQKVERAALVDRISKATDRGPEIEAKRQRIQEINQRLTTPDPAAEAELASLAERLAVLEAEQAGYLSKTDEALRRRDQVSRELNNLESAVVGITNDITAFKAKHKTDMAHEACPFCKSNQPGWQQEIVAAYELSLAQFNDRLVGRNAELELARLTYGEVEAIWMTSRKADEQNRQSGMEAAKLRDRACQIRSQAGETNSRLGLESRKLTAEIEAMRSGQQALEDCKAKLAGMPEPDEPAYQAAVGKIITLERDRKTVAATIAALEDRQRAYERAKAQEQQNAKTVLAHLESVAEVEVTKQAVQILEALQAEIVRQAFCTILERANRVTAGILKGELEYRDGELGVQRGGAWVTHQTMSGSEQALVFAGVSLALAHESPIRILLMDELSRFDAENLRALLANMQTLIQAGHLDQFVGCAVQESLGDFEGEEGINIIQL